MKNLLLWVLLLCSGIISAQNQSTQGTFITIQEESVGQLAAIKVSVLRYNNLFSDHKYNHVLIKMKKMLALFPCNEVELDSTEINEIILACHIFNNKLLNQKYGSPTAIEYRSNSSVKLFAKVNQFGEWNITFDVDRIVPASLDCSCVLMKDDVAKLAALLEDAKKRMQN